MTRSIARITTLTTAIGLTLGAACLGQSFEKPYRLKAAGEFITTEIGHSAPYIYDFDHDGVNDLLVGQFGSGKLHVFRNAGTNAKPVYEASKWFEAGGVVATVPAG